MSRYWFGNQLSKCKELLCNLGAISSYSSMLIFFWHGVEILVSKEQSKHTLVLYAGSSFFSIWWLLHANEIRNGCVSRRLLESLFSEYLWSFIWVGRRFIWLRWWYRAFILLANSTIFLCFQSVAERAFEYWVFSYFNLTVYTTQGYLLQQF